MTKIRFIFKTIDKTKRLVTILKIPLTALRSRDHCVIITSRATNQCREFSNFIKISTLISVFF